jgi:hypothetical protein
MSTGSVSAKADQLGRKADNSDVLDHAVRVGLVAYGVVHLLIAWLAAQLAFGDRAGSASGSGALAELAQKPFGQILLWLVGLGFFSLVVWMLLEAVLGHRSEDGLKRVAKRVTSLAKAVIYDALGVSALKMAIGGGGGGGDGTDGVTARLMALPLGPMLVGAVGAVILGVGGAHIYKGVTEKFTEDLKASGSVGNNGRLYCWLGKAGYVSKGVAFLVVGGLFGYAAWTHDPDKSGGLDQALKTILDQPFGAPILVLVAAGLACFGLFCFAWAKHLDR